VLPLTAQYVVVVSQLWLPSAHGWNVGALVGLAVGDVAGDAVRTAVGGAVVDATGEEDAGARVGASVDGEHEPQLQSLAPARYIDAVKNGGPQGQSTKA
jgi:hypothetical protein